MSQRFNQIPFQDSVSRCWHPTGLIRTSDWSLFCDPKAALFWEGVCSWTDGKPIPEILETSLGIFLDVFRRVDKAKEKDSEQLTSHIGDVGSFQSQHLNAFSPLKTMLLQKCPDPLASKLEVQRFQQSLCGPISRAEGQVRLLSASTNRAD